MNISEQLNLLKNIKESLKSKLLEIGAKIDDETPFSEYADFIKNAEKTVFTDSCSGSVHKHDKTSVIVSDSLLGSSISKDLSLLSASDKVNIVQETDYISLIGEMNVSNGILSGFTPNKYAVLPDVFSPGACAWEAVIKADYTADSNTQWIISPNSSAPFGNILLGINSAGRLYLLLGTNNSAWNISNTAGAAVLNSGSAYYFKLEFTGSYYNLYYSQDGENWTKDLEIASSAVIYQGQGLALGLEVFSRGNSSYWKDSIDLAESFIKIDGSLFWHGADIIHIL